MDNINGIPLVWDTQGDNALLGSLMQEGVQTQNFESLPQNNSSYESPFGEGSVFYTPQCGDFVNDFYKGGINYELLAKDLYEKAGTTDGLFFDCEKYIVANKEVMSPNPVPFVGVVYTKEKDTKPFTYENSQGRQMASFFKEAKLNRLKCYIKKRPYSFGIYFNNYKVTYALNFRYNGVNDKMYQDSETLSTSNPYDVKLDDKYKAIMLKTANAGVFLAFLEKVNGSNERAHITKRIIEYFDDFFAIAGDDADKIDALYECIPDFVLDQIPDDKLWKDLKILSEASINRSGTNENIAIINLLKGVKNKNWWYEQINSDPEPVRKILENFNEDYIYEFTPLLSSIGYGVWTQKDLAGAYEFDLKFKDFKPEYSLGDFNDAFVRYIGFSYYDEIKKKYKIGTAIFMHSPESILGIGEGREIGPDDLQLPFTPLRIALKEGVFHIPAIVAEYFTNKEIDDASLILLNNILTLLLPEIDINSARSLFTSSKVSKGKAIITIDELEKFLENVDSNLMAADLEKVGIKTLFRGTTKSSDGTIFQGNLNSITNGASTSTDPIRAIIFGIESATIGGKPGVLQVYIPKSLKGLSLQAPNRRVLLELEVIVKSSPEDLAKFAVKEIPIEDARKLAEKFFKIKLDTKIPEDYSRYLLETLPKTDLKKSGLFY